MVKTLQDFRYQNPVNYGGTLSIRSFRMSTINSRYLRSSHFSSKQVKRTRLEPRLVVQCIV